MDLNAKKLKQTDHTELTKGSSLTPTDEQYLNGIRMGKREVIDAIYQHCYPKIKSLVQKNSGNQEDARDLFQETLIAIYRNSQKTDFHLSCRFETYLYAIAKNLWLLTLRKRNINFRDIDTIVIAETIEDLEETISNAEKYQLYTKMFEQIGEQCRKLLLLYMQGVDMKTIASTFGFASESYAKKRKFKCKEQLINKISEDTDFKRIMARG